MPGPIFGMPPWPITFVHENAEIWTEELQREIGHLVVEARLPEPGQPASSGYEGEGYVIVRDPDTDVVRDALPRIISLIRVELVEAL